MALDRPGSLPTVDPPSLPAREYRRVSTEALVLALSSVIRPTSAAAVYAMLAGRRPVPLLVAFIAAGLAVSVTVGVVVVVVLGATVPRTEEQGARAVAQIVLGTAALGYAAGVQSSRMRRRDPDARPRDTSPISRLLTRLTPGGAALAGVLTHLPGLFYLAALSAIAASAPTLVSGVAQVLLYNAIWYALPGVALGFALNDPEWLSTRLQRLTAWARRNERGIVAVLFAALGAWLIVRGVRALA